MTVLSSTQHLSTNSARSGVGRGGIHGWGLVEGEFDPRGRSRGSEWRRSPIATDLKSRDAGLGRRPAPERPDQGHDPALRVTRQGAPS